jgi:hypothetical protein
MDVGLSRLRLVQEFGALDTLIINGECLDHERWALTVEDWPLIPPSPPTFQEGYA